MKLLVFSDTHRHTRRMLEVAKKEKYVDAMVFLGDGDQDADALQRRHSRTPLYRVRGNCDYYSHEPPEGLVPFGGVLFFYTHGHHYDVKHGLENLVQAARRSGADAVLYGHTHCAHYEVRDGIHLFNPGSLTMPRRGGPTYGIVQAENGKADFEIVHYPE